MSVTLRPVSPLAPRVVIVDADRRVQQSLSDLLGLTGKIAVVGRAGDVRAALEEVERSEPDVVLIDPRLPDVEAGDGPRHRHRPRAARHADRPDRLGRHRGPRRAWPAP